MISSHFSCQSFLQVFDKLALVTDPNKFQKPLSPHISRENNQNFNEPEYVNHVLFCPLAQMSVKCFRSFRAPQAPSSGMFRARYVSAPSCAPSGSALRPFRGFCALQKLFSGSTKNSLNFAQIKTRSAAKNIETVTLAGTVESMEKPVKKTREKLKDHDPAPVRSQNRRARPERKSRRKPEVVSRPKIWFI